MTQTEQSLARIFAICDQAAKTGETIRTEKEAKEAANAFLGVAQVCARRAHHRPFLTPKKIISFFTCAYTAMPYSFTYQQ